MDELKRIHKQFVVTISLFVIIVLAIFSTVWITYKYLEDPNVQYIIFFSLLIVLLFFTSMFRTRIEFVINTSYLMRINNNQGQPLEIKRIYKKEHLHSYLSGNDFNMFSNEEDYLIYYKASKDHIKKMFRGYILEIVVYLSPEHKEFYYSKIDDQIQKIQTKLAHDSKKIHKLLITQIKVVDDLDEETKKQISEIVFIRSQAGIISTINVGLHMDSNKAVMLYSDTFSPSLFYNYHIEQIKKMI